MESKQTKEPGLDGRHRDKSAPKKGEIQQKRSDTLNKNLPKPIPDFAEYDAWNNAEENRASQRGSCATGSKAAVPVKRLEPT